MAEDIECLDIWLLAFLHVLILQKALKRQFPFAWTLGAGRKCGSQRKKPGVSLATGGWRAVLQTWSAKITGIPPSFGVGWGLGVDPVGYMSLSDSSPRKKKMNPPRVTTIKKVWILDSVSRSGLGFPLDLDSPGRLWRICIR